MRNDADVKPARLPIMTFDEVKARAQRILDRRGEPPYINYAFTEQTSSDGFRSPGELTVDELAVLNEFVQYWRPYLEKKAANDPEKQP